LVTDASSSDVKYPASLVNELTIVGAPVKLLYFPSKSSVASVSKSTGTFVKLLKSPLKPAGNFTKLPSVK
jgi:hypothetical protein